MRKYSWKKGEEKNDVEKMLFTTTKAAKMKLNYSELSAVVSGGGLSLSWVELTQIKTFLCCFMWKNVYFIIEKMENAEKR